MVASMAVKMAAKLVEMTAELRVRLLAVQSVWRMEPPTVRESVPMME